MADQTYRRTVLDNGLRVLTAPMPQTRSVSVNIYVGAGSRYESPPEAGLSHFTEHLCFKGTQRRPSSRLISEAIDNVGGVLNAATDRELTVYYGKVASPHLELLTDVLTDMLRFSLFEPSEIEKERKVILEELAMVADSPAQLVDVLIDRTLWPDQPLGWDVAGTRETVSAISRDQLISYVGRQYVPNNTVVAIAGNMVEEEALEIVERLTRDWEPKAFLPWSPAMDSQNEPKAAVMRKKTEQAHLSLATHGPHLEHPDRYVFDLLSAVLGEGMSSRLFVELREKMAICYDVHSYTNHFLDTGSFVIYIAVEPIDVIRALDALMREVNRIREGVDEEELRKAKEMSKGRLLLRMEDTRNVAGWIGAQELLLGRVRSVDDVMAAIEAVTTEDVARVASSVFVEKGLNLAVVGPFRSERRFLPLLKL
ncbi:MAG: pitrilysin family protein [Dehalococcoidia bacterium]|nr:pitrilysin family protein [Dehalococcoidia bacterium]